MKKYWTVGVVGLSFLLSTSALAAQGRAVIKGTAPDSKISGEALLNEERGGLSVEATVSGVSPGKHGFHFHENSSCADAGKAAGGHFNPDKAEHGYWPKDGPQHAHAGDMGNVEVGADGKGHMKEFLPGISLTEGKYSVVGKAVILHEKEDDFSQPAGNSGERIGCGIVELSGASAGR